MLQSKIFRSLLILVVFVQILFSCTTGLVNKKFSTNKRALLWKNRDSSHEKNEVFLFDYETVKILGIINNNDTTQIWSGVNNFGFAIMNAESRDMISENGDSTQYDDEGYLMKEALKSCQTIDDFGALLAASNEDGRKVTSNFGVLDASGNAAYFETGNHKYFRFD